MPDTRRVSDSVMGSTKKTNNSPSLAVLRSRRRVLFGVSIVGVLGVISGLFCLPPLTIGFEEKPASPQSKSESQSDRQTPPSTSTGSLRERLPLTRPKTSAQESSPTPTQPQALTFDVHALWVRPKTMPNEALRLGSAPIKVEFRRSSERNAPPQIGVVEDTPVGTGTVLRSAIWQSAITAALHRNDDLAGVDVTFRFQGRIDGPSAGGILCLALLSCLDGKAIPADVAFTGTILPDGTIGQVAGIAHKLVAAKKRGCRRVIVPSFVRFQEDLETGELVDLREIAKSLDLTLYAAESIEDAYRFAHGLPAETSEPVERQVEALSNEVESWLKTQYVQHLKIGDDIFNKLPDSEKKDLFADQLFSVFFESRSQAESAYRSGRLFHAFDQVLEWSDFLQARERNKKVLEDLTAEANAKKAPLTAATLRKQLDAAITEAFKQCPNEIQLLSEASKKIGPLGAQHFADIGGVPITRAYAAALEDVLDPTIKQIQETKPEDFPDGLTAEKAVWNVVVIYKLFQLILVNGTKVRLTESISEQSHLASVLPQEPKSAKRGVAVAKFFHSGFLATHQSLDSTIAELASAYGLSHAELGQNLFESDIEYGALRSIVPMCDDLYETLVEAPPDSPQQQFFAALSTQVFAHRIAESAGLVVRWGELNTTKDGNGEWKYERVEALSFLLRRARENALKNLARCHRDRVPCPEALRHFQAAESQRDDPSIDKVSVLTEYWKSSLQAQALCMLFNPEP